MDRCGLSLETIGQWGVNEVVLALQAVTLHAPTLEPHVRKFNVDGPMLLEVMFRCSEINAVGHVLESIELIIRSTRASIVSET